jgi:ubiquinone/menaquinone biosynthesis C-methylase UbiE
MATLPPNTKTRQIVTQASDMDTAARIAGHDQTAYVFQASDPEHVRLMRLSRAMEPYVRDMCARIGLAPGSRVIEIGCGPLGALLPLSAAVGPDGVVVGLDRSGAALDQARSILTTLGVSNVCLVQADLGAVTPAELCPSGPFDLAFCRLVLCYQRDVAATLRQIAALVRPGGYVVAQETLFSEPIPITTPGPFVPAANLVINEWFRKLLEALGTRWDVAQRYSALCREAGLVEMDQRIFVPILLPEHAATGISIYHDILVGLRPLLLQHNIAHEDEVERVLGELRAAQEQAHTTTVFTHLQNELVAQVPSRQMHS